MKAVAICIIVFCSFGVIGSIASNWTNSFPVGMGIAIGYRRKKQ